MTSHQPASFPSFVAAGEALTDMIRLQGDQWVSKVGGSTWNVARVMAKLGQSSAFAGAISQDCFGHDLYAASEAAGLDLRFLQQLNFAPLLAMVHSTNPPRYFFVGENAADLHFAAAKLPEGWKNAVQWVHFGGISLAREPLAANLLTLARELKSLGVKISYDPNFRILMTEQYDAMLLEMTKLADVIKVSDEDLVGLFRHDDLERSISTLRNWNPAAMILYTRGAQGASLYRNQELVSEPALRINVADTVGAGDASMGGLIFSLLNHPERTSQQHLHFAIASGAAACLHAGATPPTLHAVNTLYAR
ncbi:carbohydrate kinase [Chitinibacter fontanus]|uniref:Carbohydrate kinase n=1 Tax=Chitinibacter fontanus TaxID=1737446 RepID=A0A7D5ZD20_9NEIS|nr:carbohydrate kinase [Chitinibacter fontanus]QLI80944.1 carbohydrate kinase [Chitinibacter fontanus]